MKAISKLHCLLVVVMVILASCSNDDDTQTQDGGVYAIRSIFGYGKTNSKYIYNSFGKVAEYQSFYFYRRYVYDNMGRLVKEEIAVDPDLYSSVVHENTELMTSKNSTITGYNVYEYDTAGVLKDKKYYNKTDGVYEFKSKISFEYEDGNIIKWNLLNAGDTITQFYAYEYDKNRNVINEKQYSYIFIEGPGPELIRETTYKYDDKNNPFKIFREAGNPGLFSNTNNIIESNSILYEDVPGIDKYSTSKTNYVYNSKGFPVKEITANSVYEYIYN
jgi:hypothetical protein